MTDRRDPTPTQHPNRERWERYPQEPEPAWTAFQTYRDMPSPRSVRKIAAQLGYSGHTQIGRFSSAWNWQERAAAFDLEQDRQRLAARKVENVKAGAAMATTAASARQIVATINLKWLEHVAPTLDSIEAAALTDMMIRANRVLPRLIVAERLARGMSTEHMEVRGDVDVHRREVEGWSEERLDAFLAGAVSAGRVHERDRVRELEAGEDRAGAVEGDA